MKPHLVLSHICWLEMTDSTNKELRRRLDSLDNLSVIAAKGQFAGKGQGEHTWTSEPGANLTFTFLMRYDTLPLDCDDLLLITCTVTLGIRDYLLGKGVEAGIKWPNDIWVDGRKICGILIENILEGKNVASSIVGVGLNVNQTEWPAELPNPVSLKTLTGSASDLERELEVLMGKISRRYGQLCTGDGRKDLRQEFEKHMFRLP